MKPETKKNIGPETTAMAELLGRLDATFWPSRGRQETRQAQVVWERQQAWLSGKGLPVRTHGAADVERKAAEGVYRTIERAGLVTIAARKGRRTHVRFTETGETFTRILCGTGFVFLYWDEFQALASLFDETGEIILPESFTAGAEPWLPTADQIDRLSAQKFHFLPFASAGLLDFSADAYGRCWVAITPKGHQAIETGPPGEPPESWELNEEASAVYDAAYAAEEQALATAKPDRPSNLIIPAACGRGWGDYAPVLADRKAQTR